jgi:hypothetical protein
MAREKIRPLLLGDAGQALEVGAGDALQRAIAVHAYQYKLDRQR